LQRVLQIMITGVNRLIISVPALKTIHDPAKSLGNKRGVAIGKAFK
jgi:hypothetical protein